MQFVVARDAEWCCISYCLMEAADKTKDRVIISPSLLCWDPKKYVYHPAFDLGIGEEFMGVYLCVYVGCYQRENIELYFIMPMDNIIAHVHIMEYEVHF